jgi:hypothetical protein
VRCQRNDHTQSSHPWGGDAAHACTCARSVRSLCSSVTMLASALTAKSFCVSCATAAMAASSRRASSSSWPTPSARSVCAVEVKSGAQHSQSRVAPLLQQLTHPQCKVSLRSGGQEWSTTLTEQGCSPPPAADPPPVQGQSAQWRSRVEHNTHRAGLLRSQMSLSSWKASTKHRAVRARGGSLLPRVESSRASPPHSPQTAGG